MDDGQRNTRVPGRRTPSTAPVMAAALVIVSIGVALVAGRVMIGMIEVMIRLLALVTAVGLIAFGVLWLTMRSWVRSWRRKGETARTSRTKTDTIEAMVEAALADAPDMRHQVEAALGRIDRLRAVDARQQDEHTAEAVAMADGWMRIMLRNHVDTAPAAFDDERRHMAHVALGSVVDVGRIAEDARRRAVERASSQMKGEAKLIAERAGDWDLKSID